MNNDVEEFGDSAEAEAHADNQIALVGDTEGLDATLVAVAPPPAAGQRVALGAYGT